METDITYEINGGVMQFEKGNAFLRFAVKEMVRGTTQRLLMTLLMVGILVLQAKGEIDYMKRNDVGPAHFSNCRKKLCPKPVTTSRDSRVLYTCPRKHIAHCT